MAEIDLGLEGKQAILALTLDGKPVTRLRMIAPRRPRPGPLGP